MIDCEFIAEDTEKENFSYRGCREWEAINSILLRSCTEHGPTAEQEVVS